MPLKAPLDRVFLEYANNQPRRNVRRASTHMYGEIRHDKDCNDIALVFLESPFDLAPGAVETIRVDSTRQVERGDVVSGLGYGFFTRNSACPQGQWECRSYDCVAQDKVCDGVKDCKDVSDEYLEYCEYSNAWPKKVGQIGYWIGAHVNKIGWWVRDVERFVRAMHAVGDGLAKCRVVFEQFLVENDKEYRLVDIYEPLVGICKEFNACYSESVPWSNKDLDVCEDDIWEEKAWFIKAAITCKRDIERFLEDRDEERRRQHN